MSWRYASFRNSAISGLLGGLFLATLMTILSYVQVQLAPEMPAFDSGFPWWALSLFAVVVAAICGGILGLTLGGLYATLAAREQLAFGSDVIASMCLTLCYFAVGGSGNRMIFALASEPLFGGVSIFLGNVVAAAIYRHLGGLPFHLRLREAVLHKD